MAVVKIPVTPSIPDSLEDELLLCCARTSLGANKAARIEELLRADVDWERLLRTAQDHGVTALLSRSLGGAFPEAVPEDVLGRLRERSGQNSLRNLLLAGELLELLDLFEQRGVPAIPYKGPTLAAAVYGDLGLRSPGDLDILVPERHFPEARGLLLSRGYRMITPWLNGAQEAAFLHFERERAFAHDGLRLIVEIQWELMPDRFAFPLDVEDLEGRLQTVPVCSGSVSTLSPEDLLLTLCVHGSKHLWKRLQWVCDVAETLRVYPEMDWALLMEGAAARGSLRMLFLGLSLANDLLEAELPESVLNRMSYDPAVRKLAAQTRGWMFRESGKTRGVVEGSAFYPYHLRVRERSRDSLRYLIRKVATPNRADWLNTPLPERLFFLYYALKPVRMAGKYGKRLLGRAAW